MTAATNIVSIADRLAAYDADPGPRPMPALIDLPEIVRLSDVEPQPVEWLWPGWLPKGMLTILGGFAGDGKSTLTLALAAAFSTGGPLPDGTPAPITNTMLLLAEDDIRRAVLIRLEEHGADRTRILASSGFAADGVTPYTFNLRDDARKLRARIIEHNIGLLVIDPISGFLASGDRNSEGEVREMLGPLLQVAEELGVAVIGIMHIGKSEGYQRSTQRLMGSTAFVAVARSVWMIAPLPAEKQTEGEPVQKVLGVEKSNYAVAPKPLLFSRGMDAPLKFHGESPMLLEDVLSWRKRAPEQEKGSEERDAAKAFLYRFLAGGMKSPVEIERAGHAEGHTKRMLRRAKEEMNIQSIKVKNNWFWSLPME